QIMGNHRDYLNIVYRGNSQLLVPLDQFRLVRKFVSREGVIPKLNKLGGDDWNKTKQRLKENVDEIADRLVKLYADRRENIGFAFPEDDEEQLAFEKSFAYKLTPDQERAVQEMKEDMMSDKPMDRLLCGDVGFGKTEVAIRGAFKAVLAGKQVAFLCPTTILSEQHFRTFMGRFKDYPVDIRVLNRFATPSYVRDSLDAIKKGSVDVLIGTHRILSKDVQFKDLGLLIIDEEQRFGVEHKEKIKELKSSVDVITLSATPIPRTLQMSLVGIRQLSQLDTPPENRYPVQTYIVEKNGGLIKEVIQKELAREGQVFYLHNNVEQIYNTARKIKNLVPKANIGIAHGQMNKEDIEEVMLKFNHHEIDVLVCTTIIETGLDIPNANTILVEDAQNFGLAQLYQIKGRVGRSNRLAYAYLMIPEKRQLSEVAEKRLKAIKEFTQLGSGYKIAMRDLTIRGAGDLLGPSQSGFIDTVGIDMYIEMLNEAINEKKGIVKEEKPEMKRANINLDGYIPEGFAPDDYDKISLYQQIDKIETLEEWKELLDKVTDEFGKLPKNVQLLFDKKHLDILINDPSVEHYGVVKGKTEIVFTKEFSDHINGVKLFEIMNSISKDIQLKYVSNKISVTIPKCKNELQLSVETIIRSKEAINKHAHR
ncbi:MAG: transcription-repair coupling factor, partial [Erysipelotrichaceae bacterium]|nr:transcription-repair coupling factor [Erysipelotrichaceae bacterium]